MWRMNEVLDCLFSSNFQWLKYIVYSYSLKYWVGIFGVWFFYLKTSSQMIFINWVCLKIKISHGYHGFIISPMGHIQPHSVHRILIIVFQSALLFAVDIKLSIEKLNKIYSSDDKVACIHSLWLLPVYLCLCNTKGAFRIGYHMCKTKRV